MDRMDRLRAFIQVAERGSFIEAAKTLRVSPTAVTRAVAALENMLGAQLLRRTTRSVRLTDEGAIYLDRVRRALIDLDDAARIVAGEDGEPQGLLIVSAPVMFGRLHIVPVVADLLRRHPRLTVRLTLTDRMVRLVEEGIDVTVRIGHLPDSNLLASRIGEVRRVLVASPDYLRARGAPTRIADLRDHDLIAFEQLSANDEWRFDAGASVRLNSRLLTNSADAAIEATLRGCGILRTFDYQVRAHLSHGQLVEVLANLEPVQAPAPVSIVHCASRHPSANLRAFIAATARAVNDLNQRLEC